MKERYIIPRYLQRFGRCMFPTHCESPVFLYVQMYGKKYFLPLGFFVIFPSLSTYIWKQIQAISNLVKCQEKLLKDFEKKG